MSEKKPLSCKNGKVRSLQKTEAGYKFGTLYFVNIMDRITLVLNFKDIMDQIGLVQDVRF